MRKPILYLIVGLPGSGKTTRAKQIEVEHNALRLNPDEFILEKHGHGLSREQSEAVRTSVEAQHWQTAEKALAQGFDVVLEFGFWTKAERSKFRSQAQKLGANVKTIFMDADIDELWRRVSRRPESKRGTLKISRADLEEWSKKFEPPTEEELH